MKETAFRIGATALGAALAAYFGALAVPLVVLLFAMLLDYTTGVAKAFIAADLSSRVGLRGIVKKVCCLALVAVGVAVDYLIRHAIVALGLDMNLELFCGLLVTVWLIVNELLSVLENLAAIGVPGFPALEKLIRHLKGTIEKEEEK